MKFKELAAVIVIFLPVIVLSGCGSFWKGAAVGAVGVGAVDAVSAKSQMDRLDEDYKAGKITQQEYEIRRDQVKKGSLIY